MPYQHTQPGVAILGLILIMALAIGLVGAALPGAGATLWVPDIGLVVIGVLLGWMKVEVTPRLLKWQFGLGYFRYQLDRAEIEAVAVVRNSWTNGLGIRRARGFRLYSVSGLDAVEITLRNGERWRIGSDDAPNLAAALSPSHA